MYLMKTAQNNMRHMLVLHKHWLFEVCAYGKNRGRFFYSFSFAFPPAARKIATF